MFGFTDVRVEDSGSELYGSRKRLLGLKKDSEKLEKGKGSRAKRSHKAKQDHQKHKYKRNDWTVVVTEVIDNVETANTNSNYTDDNISIRDEDQDSAFESDEERDDYSIDKENYSMEQPSHQTKSAISAFLPPQHLWP